MLDDDPIASGPPVVLDSIHEVADIAWKVECGHRIIVIEINLRIQDHFFDFGSGLQGQRLSMRPPLGIP
jgi:hypothetical protein